MDKCKGYGQTNLVEYEGEIIKLTRAKTEREKTHNPRPITIMMTK